MEKKELTPKKIDITSLKVIDKKKLNSVYGGSAPAKWSSWSSDSDKGGFCSIYDDTDSGS